MISFYRALFFSLNVFFAVSLPLRVGRGTSHSVALDLVFGALNAACVGARLAELARDAKESER